MSKNKVRNMNGVKNSLSNINTCTHTHKSTLTHTRMRHTLMAAATHTHAHTHIHTHTLTHTHTFTDTHIFKVDAGPSPQITSSINFTVGGGQSFSLSCCLWPREERECGE